MDEGEFGQLIRRNSINRTILERLPELQQHAPQVHLTAGALFGTVWNLQAGQPATEHIPDYDLFYWHPDLSYEAEDRAIAHAGQLFADLNVKIELRNQARVHLWFNPKHGLSRPPISSARQGIDQFLVRCTCLGVNAAGEVYAPYGLAEMASGVLRLNPHNPSPGLYAAKVQSYLARWPWLRDLGAGLRSR